MIGFAGPAKGSAIPRTFFGMHIENAVPKAYNLYNQYQCPLFSDIGYGSIRTWDSYTTQLFTNPSNGTYSWTALDTIVGAYQAAGLDITYTFGAMPGWATGTSPTHFNPAPPTSMAYLTSYVTALATRYKGVIASYETWNEIDSSGSWSGTVAQMQAIMQAVYPAVKAADPAARVLSPNVEYFGSMNTGGGLFLLDQVLQGGNSAYADALAVHTYCDPQQPEFIVAFGQYARALAAKYGFAQVWATESGVLSYYDSTGTLQTPNTGGTKMPAAQASGRVTRMGLCHWLGGFTRWNYFSLDGNGIMAWDMVNYAAAGPTATTEYAPATAYKFLVAALTGAYVFNYQQAGSVFSCQFVQASGRRGSIYWTADYGSATVNAVAAVQVTDNLGNALTASAVLAIGSQPVFVWWS